MEMENWFLALFMYDTKHALGSYLWGQILQVFLGLETGKYRSQVSQNPQRFSLLTTEKLLALLVDSTHSCTSNRLPSWSRMERRHCLLTYSDKGTENIEISSKVFRSHSFTFEFQFFYLKEVLALMNLEKNMRT